MNRSESISELAKALAEYHKEVKQPKKDADNPFFKSKYVPLDNIIDVTEKVLANHGLSVMQWVTTLMKEQKPSIKVYTEILHSSGEFIIYDPIEMIPESIKPQAFGSAITYGKRYALASILGIASDIDDDGNEASGLSKDSSKEVRKATPNQIKLIKELVNDITSMCDYLGIENIEDMTMQQASAIISRKKGEKKHE